MFGPEKFVEQCRSAGFEPAQAMMLYSEFRMFGAHQIQVVEKEETGFFNILSKHAFKALEEIKTPEDFKAYCNSWEARCKDVLQEWGKGIGNVPGATFNLIPRKDLLARMSGGFGLVPPEEWTNWQDQGMDWEDLAAVLQSNAMDLTKHRTSTPPESVTTEAAHQRLEESVKRAGLAAFVWPWVQGASRESMWALADQVDTAAQEIHAKTGWAPGALGLEGRVVLRLGLGDPADSSAFCCDWSKDCQLIETTPQTDWGAYSHEWMHGVDHVLHHSGHAEALKAWENIHGDLDRITWAEKDRETLEGLLKGVVENSWKDRPTVLATLQELEKLPVIGTEDEHRLRQAMDKDSVAHNDVERADLRTVIALTELQLLRQGLKDTESLWNRYGQTFSILAKEKLPSARANEWQDYFTIPEERVTHSFESTFKKNSIISDVVANASLRYPLKPEVVQHDMAWKRFFRSSKGWYESLKPAQVASPQFSAPDEWNLAARHKERKQRMDVASVTSSAPKSFMGPK